MIRTKKVNSTKPVTLNERTFSLEKKIEAARIDHEYAEEKVYEKEVSRINSISE